MPERLSLSGDSSRDLRTSPGHSAGNDSGESSRGAPEGAAPAPLSQSVCRRWTIYRGADVVDDDGSRWEYPTVADPELQSGEEVEVVDAAAYERLRAAIQAALHSDLALTEHDAEWRACRDAVMNDLRRALDG